MYECNWLYELLPSFDPSVLIAMIISRGILLVITLHVVTSNPVNGCR